jgi:hypothetical protein
MLFTLEALQAAQGDCLLLHYGPSESPLVALIDGGPNPIYKDFLRPRLEELRAVRGDPLKLQLVAVSHIDDDHINGIIDLTADMLQRQEDGEELPYDILALWHNSFDDILGSGQISALPSSVAALADGAVPSGVAVEQPTELVVASIPQGRKLRDNAAALALDVNAPFDGLVLAPREVDWGDGLKLTVVGPSQERVDDLQQKWDADVRRRSLSPTQAAAYLDRSVYNLSSIVFLAEVRKKRMLLTGDARGDDILAGLREAGLLDRPPLHVDLLKLPHHGSDRNVETEFFRKIVADHYVASGDGTDDNPEIAALKMISEAREDDDFTVHLTNRTGEKNLGRRLRDFEDDERRRGRRYAIEFRETQALSLKVDLLEEVTD